MGLNVFNKLYKLTRRKGDAAQSPRAFQLLEGLESRQMLSVAYGYPPAEPTNLTAKSASSSSVAMHWSDNSTRENGYKIERSTDGSSFSQIKLTSANVTSFTDTSRTSGKRYYYRVRAYSAVDGNSPFSNTASAVPGATTSSSSVLGSYSDGVYMNSKDDPSRIIPYLRDLGVKTVLMTLGAQTYDHRAWDTSLDRALKYKAAGFKVLMRVSPKYVPSYSQAKAFFDYYKNHGALRAADMWQIGNEPNISKQWYGTMSQYVNNVLKAAWDSWHGLTKIVGAGPSWDAGAARSLVSMGYNKYCDYAAFHPYGSSPSQVAQRARDAKAAYQGKPMIVTEWNIRNATSSTDWANKVKATQPLLKPYCKAAYYFCFQVTNTMAGPAGLINGDWSHHSIFYNSYKSWDHYDA